MKKYFFYFVAFILFSIIPTANAYIYNPGGSGGGSTNNVTFTGTTTFSGGTQGINGTDMLSSTTERDSYGRYNLNGLEYDLANAQQKVKQQTKIAFIGDSWVAGPHFTPDFYNFVNNNFAFAGAGYVAFDTTGEPPLGGVVRTTVGTWTDSALHTGLGPDLMQTTSSDNTTPGYKTINCIANTMTIYYLLQSGGGSFDYSIDNGATTTISTSAASNELGTTTISGLTYAAHTLTVAVHTPSTAGITMFGAECQMNNTQGVEVIQLGSSGSTADEWAADMAANPNVFESEIEALSPSMVAITLGTNDIVTDSVATYDANIASMISYIQAASSTISILLLPPTVGGRTGPAGDVSAYFPGLQDMARANGYGFLEVAKDLGPYLAASSSGMWQQGGVHMTPQGDQLFSNQIVSYLGLDLRNQIGNGILNIAGSSYYGPGSGPLYTAGVGGSTAFQTPVYNYFGTSNTFVGSGAGAVATGTSNSTLIGQNAGLVLLSGTSNTAIGTKALDNDVIGISNVAVGVLACQLTTGSQNTCLGTEAGQTNTTGSYNINIGQNVVSPVLTGNQQLNIGNLAYGTGLFNLGANSSVPVSAGRFDIGSSTPWARLGAAVDVWSATAPMFAISSSSPTATTTPFQVDHNGNPSFGGQTASVSCAATCTLDGNSSDSSGLIYISGSQTAVTLTFTSTKPFPPHCVASDTLTTGTYDASSTATTVVFTTASSIGTSAITYWCPL